MAGFLAAHGILCVSEGGPLIPFVGMEAVDGKRSLERLVTERQEDGVAEGMKQLRKNPWRSVRAILVFDGFVTLEMGRADALIVQAHIYGVKPDSLQVVVPYRSVAHEKHFGVYGQRITQREGRTVSEDLLNDAFMQGVRSHMEGAKVWDAHVIQSK
jgi:hypothetical protein